MDRHAGPLARRLGGGYRVQTDQGAMSLRQRRDRDRRMRDSRRVPRFADRAAASPSRSSRRRATSGPPTCPRARSLSSAPPRSGLQIARELARSGRRVTLAVGQSPAPAAPLPGRRHPVVDASHRGPRRALQQGATTSSGCGAFRRCRSPGDPTDGRPRPQQPAGSRGRDRRAAWRR